MPRARRRPCPPSSARRRCSRGWTASCEARSRTGDADASGREVRRNGRSKLRRLLQGRGQSGRRLSLTACVLGCCEQVDGILLRIQARWGEVAVAHPIAVVDHDEGSFEHHSRRKGSDLVHRSIRQFTGRLTLPSSASHDYEQTNHTNSTHLLDATLTTSNGFVHHASLRARLAAVATGSTCIANVTCSRELTFDRLLRALRWRSLFFAAARGH